MGKAPSLQTLTETFGYENTIVWLEIQLKDLSEFAGCKDKLTVQQIDNIARLIAHCYPTFKLTELMYFFVQFKAGKYGKFYGAVDGLKITSALQEFSDERKLLKDEFYKEEEAEQQEVLAKIKSFIWDTMKAENDGNDPNFDDFEKRCAELTPNMLKLVT